MTLHEADLLGVRNFVTSDGTALTYRVHGKAPDRASDRRPAVMALPGHGRSIADLEPLAAALCGNRRVYTVGPRQSDAMASDVGPRSVITALYVRDVYELWRQLGEGSVVLFGSGLGALLAVLMVEDHPDMLAGVVLSDLGDSDDEGLAGLLGHAGRLPDLPSLTAAMSSVRKRLAPVFERFTDGDWIHIAMALYEFRDGHWHHRYEANRQSEQLDRSDLSRDIRVLHGRAEDLDLPILSIRGRQTGLIETAGREPERMADLDTPESLALINEFLAKL